MFGAIKAGKALDAPRVREAVTSMTDSIVRNPDAMLLLARMKEKGEHNLDRALGVSIYMITFGRFLHLPREQLDLLGMLGLLQDVGKLRLPAQLLNKKEPLSEAELERLQEPRAAFGRDPEGDRRASRRAARARGPAPRALRRQRLSGRPEGRGDRVVRRHRGARRLLRRADRPRGPTARRSRPRTRSASSTTGAISSSTGLWSNSSSSASGSIPWAASSSCTRARSGS